MGSVAKETERGEMWGAWQREVVRRGAEEYGKGDRVRLPGGCGDVAGRDGRVRRLVRRGCCEEIYI